MNGRSRGRPRIEFTKEMTDTIVSMRLAEKTMKDIAAHFKIYYGALSNWCWINDINTGLTKSNAFKSWKAMMLASKK